MEVGTNGQLYGARSLIFCWHAVQINTLWRLNSRFLGGQVVVIDRGAVMSGMDKVLKRGH